MGNLVSAYPRPPRSRRRSRGGGGGGGGGTRRRPLAAPADVLLGAVAGGGDALASALAALPPSSASLVCRQDPRLLHAAAASGDLRVLRAVLDRGANLAAPSPTLGAAPLHAAATPPAALLLVASGANAFLADARGRTPADLAGVRGGRDPPPSPSSALVRALESGAPFSGRAALLFGASSSSSSSSSSSPSSPPPLPPRSSASRAWVEAWVVVSPLYESRPFGAPPRMALSGELRAYAIPGFVASAADTAPLAAAAPFLRVPLDGCRVVREAEEAGSLDAVVGGSAGGGRFSDPGTGQSGGGGGGGGGNGVRLVVLAGDPRCLLPRAWREEEGASLALRLRPSSAAAAAPSQAFSRLVALCRDASLREAAAAAAAAGGLAVAAASASGAATAAATTTAAAACAAAAPTIPLPPPEVMAAAEERELVEGREEEQDGHGGGGGGGNGGNGGNGNGNGNGDGGACVVCWSARASMALRHGQSCHVCACARCARRLATSLCPACPVCRAPVREVLAAY